MEMIYFVVGFMLCGFIACGIATSMIHKVLKGENVCGFEVKPIRKYTYTPYNTYSSYYNPRPSYTPRHYVPEKSIGEKMQLAEEIVELFEDLIEHKRDELTASPESWEGNRKAYIYGENYADLVDQVQELL